MCINSYHSPMTKRIFQMNSRKYQNTGGKVEVLPPPHSDPLYNEVSNSFFNQVFRKCQLILGILINFSSLSKWNLTENWYLPITISKNTYCLYFRLYFRLFSHSRSLYRDAYILSHKSAFTNPPTPQLFSPSLHSVALYLALLGLPTPCFAQATTVRLWSGWSLCSLSYKFLLGKIILPLSCLSAECSLVAGFGCPQVGLYLSGSYVYICLFVNLS